MESLDMAAMMWGIDHIKVNVFAIIRHKLLMVRDTSRNGYKEDLWLYIWPILRELYAVRFVKKREKIKKSFEEEFEIKGESNLHGRLIL